MANHIFTTKIATSDINEALEGLGLNWDVREEGLMSDTLIEIPKHKTIIRQDNNAVLGVVGKTYGTIQNSTAFTAIDQIAKQYDAEYQYGLAMKGGARIAIQAKLNQGFTVNGDDRTDLYITMINSHDGSSGLRVMMTPIRLFCMNQLSKAKKQAVENINIRHTTNSDIMLVNAMQVFGGVLSDFKLFKERAEIMANKFVDTAMVNAFLDSVVGEEIEQKGERVPAVNDKRETITRLFEEGMGNKGETLWDLYNGVTEYTTHHAGRDDNRFESLVFGSSLNLNTRAFHAASALC